MRIFIVLFLGVVYAFSSYGQEAETDTLPHYFLKEVRVTAKNRKHSRQSRLEYNVRKVYPYACIAARKIDQINSRLHSVSAPKKRKEIIRSEYRELMKTFKKPLMRLSFTQGRILVKLIYRETDNTAFSHIREYKGGFNAYFWQSVALVFGNNLKAGYEPEGKDADIEKIVLKIKSEEQAGKPDGK